MELSGGMVGIGWEEKKESYEKGDYEAKTVLCLPSFSSLNPKKTKFPSIHCSKVQIYCIWPIGCDWKWSLSDLVSEGFPRSSSSHFTCHSDRESCVSDGIPTRGTGCLFSKP
jgi:hypothetical protein